MTEKVRSPWPIVLLILSTALAGCDGGAPRSDDESRDAGADGDSGSPDEGSAPPDASPDVAVRPEDWSVPKAEFPTAPILVDWACPPGWNPTETFVDENGRADVLDGIPQHSHCRPPSPARDCAPGTMPKAGSAECVRHGPPCPTAEEKWPSGAELRGRAPGYDGNIVYAAPGATQPADGSRALPHGKVADAVSTARAGDIVAVALGETSEIVVLPRAIALVGACVEGTRINAPSRAESVATVRIRDSGGVLLRDLTLSGPRPGVSSDGAATASRLESVRIEGALAVAVTSARGHSISAADLYVKDTAPAENGYGAGLINYTETEATLERSAFESCAELGVGVSGPGSRLIGHGLVIMGTLNRGDRAGAGLFVAREAFADVRSSIVDGSTGWSIIVGTITDHEEEATPPQLVLTDVAVRGPPVGESRGILVSDGASASLNRVLVNVPGAHQVSVSDLGHLEMVDSLLLGMPSEPEDPKGRGLYVAAGSTAIVEGSIILGATTRGIDLETEGTLAATDLVVAGTQHGSGGEAGASLSLTRTAFARNAEHGLYVLGPGIEAVLTDVWLGETKPAAIMRDSGARIWSGPGLVIAGGAHLAARRIMSARTHLTGIAISGEETTADLEDATVIQVASVGERACAEAMGFVALDGADVKVERLTVKVVQGIAVQALLDAKLGVDGLWVNDVESVPCGTSDLARPIGGFGVSSDLRGTLDLRDFLVEKTARAGLQVAADSHLCAHAGELRVQPVCVNDQHRPGELVGCSTDVTFNCDDRDDSEEIPPPSISQFEGLDPAP